MTIERLLEAGRALDAGDLERADQLYRQVTAADPRSSIAVVGLARVALRRGATDEALRLAQSALSIDPANAAALRMVEGNGSRGQLENPAAGTVGAQTGMVGEKSDMVGEKSDMVGAQSGARLVSRADPVDAEREPEPEADWPWPDLEEQLARYQDSPRGWLGRILGRRSR